MTAPKWTILGPSGPDWLGFLPSFLDDNNPAPARDQLDANYQHGGGWRPFDGFKMKTGGSLHYPGDPPLRPVATAQLRDETLYVYPHAWVAIVQPDGAYEVARMD